MKNVIDAIITLIKRNCFTLTTSNIRNYFYENYFAYRSEDLTDREVDIKIFRRRNDVS